VHLTPKTTEREIIKLERFVSFGGPIFALLGVVHRYFNTHSQLRLATMLPAEKVTGGVVVPPGSRRYFKLIAPWGIYTSIKCLSGNYMAPFSALSFDGYAKKPMERGKGMLLISVVDMCVLAFWAFTLILNVRYP
jgi:hypothetical protein